MRKLGLVLGLMAGVAFVSAGMAGDGYGDKKLGDVKNKCSCPSNTARGRPDLHSPVGAAVAGHLLHGDSRH